MFKKIAKGFIVTTLAVGAVGVLVATTLDAPKWEEKIVPASTPRVVAQAPTQETLPQAVAPTEFNKTETASGPKRRVLNFTKRNTIAFRGVVDSEYVAQIQKKIMEVSRNLPSGEKIYLVLDTPGGSISDGRLLIDTIQGLPQSVDTVTIFAASMGFHMAQNLGKRYIIPSGVLMSHRARVSGLSGEIPGELLVRTNYLYGEISDMERIAAARMSLSFKDYQDLIRDEYWVRAGQAVEHRVADEVILARCGEDMMGTYWQSFATIFGTIRVQFSECPLISAPISIGFGYNSDTSSRERVKLEEFGYLMLLDREAFVEKYITTGDFYHFYAK